MMIVVILTTVLILHSKHLIHSSYFISQPGLHINDVKSQLERGAKMEAVDSVSEQSVFIELAVCSAVELSVIFDIECILLHTNEMRI
jgi:hypothetical protein